MKNFKIAVVGYKGKMGSIVFEILKKRYNVIGIGRNDVFCSDANLVIDFASAESSVDSAKWCAEKKVPLIIGSTGQSESQMNEIIELSKFVPILKAGNFSIGVNNLKKSLKKLITKDAQDITIFEKHHKNKKDAPSGTAKEIAGFIMQNFNIKPNVIFERGGKEIGEHIVSVYYENEVVSIKHKVFSREAFADGVLKAVLIIKNIKNSGLYSLEDINF